VDSNSVDLVIEPGRVKGRSPGGHEVTPTAGSGWCRPPPRTFGQLLSRPRTPQPAATATSSTGVRCRARRSNSCRAEIGSRYGVPAWRVKKRRKELGVHRPVGPPPRPALPNAPPADVLHRWYVDQGRALGQIARRSTPRAGCRRPLPLFSPSCGPFASTWRRQHQARARASHYRARANQHDHELLRLARTLVTLLSGRSQVAAWPTREQTVSFDRARVPSVSMARRWS